MTKCTKCGGELPAGVSMRRRYCSVACRRAVEFEIRRIDGQLATLEEQQSYARINDCPWQDDPRLLDCEIARLRKRLRSLLDDGTAKEAGQAGVGRARAGGE